MTITGWIQIIALVAVLTGLTPLLGGYMARVYQGDRVTLTTVFGPLERLIYRVWRVDGSEEQGWKQYARYGNIQELKHAAFQLCCIQTNSA
jgi:potassium-transporting ATPase potassium-binding subunit